MGGHEISWPPFLVWGACGYSWRMLVLVLYFGVLRETMGRSDEAIELGEGASVGELLQILRVRASNDSMANDRLWQSLAVAVNREYVSAETVLRGGDEVALLPPVSGGVLRGQRKASFARKDSRQGRME